MAPSQAGSYDRANRLRAARVAAGDGPDERGSDGVEALLLFLLCNPHAALSEPLTGRGIENGGDRSAASAGLALKVLLEVLGNAPAIDFGLHALQCSASCLPKQGGDQRAIFELLFNGEERAGNVRKHFQLF
jgi:hypothetical protein